MGDYTDDTLMEAEFKEWKHVVQEIIRFLKADSSFMNMRPLRYSFTFDTHPDSLSSIVSCNGKRHLVLRDALLSSYYHNEVKFTELTLDTFRMLQYLEWEPSGFFYLKGGDDSSHNRTGSNRINPLQDIRDPTLPPNPRKVILYRLPITHLLMVLSTIYEELPTDGILLIYLSAVNPHTHQLKLCNFDSVKVLVKGEANISYISLQILSCFRAYLWGN